MCRRSCPTNCQCGVESIVAIDWPSDGMIDKSASPKPEAVDIAAMERGTVGPDQPKNNVEKLGVTADTMKQLGLGPQLAAVIRRTTPAECITGGLRALLTQLESSAPVQVCEIADEDELLINEPQEWPEVEFEVALDSGSVVHVCSNADTLGYLLEPSPESKRNQHF